MSSASSTRPFIAPSAPTTMAAHHHGHMHPPATCPPAATPHWLHSKAAAARTLAPVRPVRSVRRLLFDAADADADADLEHCGSAMELDDNGSPRFDVTRQP
eukprot:EC793280.1.p4 GENE.EC793280.1~~EC793280.1.p4  ORF type:complete len:101 (+),score=24.34 EC793280.1:2-304(+)